MLIINGIKDGLLGVDNKTVALCLGGDGTMKDPIKVFTKHGEGKSG